MTHLRMDAAANKVGHILDGVFYDGAPVWKRPFAAHVKAWERHVQRISFHLFHNDPAFRSAYHERGGLMGREAAIAEALGALVEVGR